MINDAYELYILYYTGKTDKSLIDSIYGLVDKDLLTFGEKEIIDICNEDLRIVWIDSLSILDEYPDFADEYEKSIIDLLRYIKLKKLKDKLFYRVGKKLFE